MSFAESVARQQEAVFRTLGEDATWQGVAGKVRVIRREADEEMRFGGSGFGGGEIVATGRTIRVRKSQVAAPADDQTVQILDAAGAPVAGALYRVAGTPEIDRKGVWHCRVKL